MRTLHRLPVALLGGLSIACPAEVASPMGGDTGGASNSETGATPSPTEPGGPDDSSDGAGGSTANLDPGDTAASGSSDTGSSGGSSSVGGSSSSGGDTPVCGDGQQDPGEACDDGNAGEFDGCLVTCELGPGALVEQHALPPLGMLEYRRCFTAIDPQQLPGEGHALVLGSNVEHAGPAQQAAARVQQLRLPELAAPEWSYFEWAGTHSRTVQRMVTAANGDVIVAGLVRTEDIDIDSGGYLWLARFTPGGTLVWSEEYMDHWLRPDDLELAPDGDIVIVGSFSGFGATSSALRFHDDGQLVWKRGEPGQEGFIRYYRELTLDDDGNLYILAVQFDYQTEQTALVLQALTGDGVPSWVKVHPPPEPVGLSPGGLVWTPDDRLVVSANRYDLESLAGEDQLVLAAFDAAGDKLWWKLWGTGQANHLYIGELLANDDGSVHAVGGQSDLEGNATIAALATRFDADGALVWARLTPGASAVDALHGPDGRLHVLAQDSVLIHQP